MILLTPSVRRFLLCLFIDPFSFSFDGELSETAPDTHLRMNLDGAFSLIVSMSTVYPFLSMNNYTHAWF